MVTKAGARTVLFSEPPSISTWANAVSKKESEGPIGKKFDIIELDPTFGQKSWEKAESAMISATLMKLLEKAEIKAEDVDCVFAGDLINQCTSSTYALRDYKIPMFGVYSACATMAETIALASLTVDSKVAKRAVAITSSHFCTAERQFRFPLEYGGVRPLESQWTATASGAVLIEKTKTAPFIRGFSIGVIEDKGVKDAGNMGAAMAPAAASVIKAFFEDTKKSPSEFDLIITGDLGYIGSQLLLSLMKMEGIDIEKEHSDCGLMLYDRKRQEVSSGGSGCGCSAAVLTSVLLPSVQKGRLKNILFVATGALLSPMSVQQKESVPGTAHLIWLSTEPNDNN